MYWVEQTSLQITVTLPRLKQNRHFNLVYFPFEKKKNWLICLAFWQMETTYNEITCNLVQHSRQSPIAVVSLKSRSFSRQKRSKFLLCFEVFQLPIQNLKVSGDKA